jgi:hypothetical protein
MHQIAARSEVLQFDDGARARFGIVGAGWRATFATSRVLLARGVDRQAAREKAKQVAAAAKPFCEVADAWLVDMVPKKVLTE